MGNEDFNEIDNPYMPEGEEFWESIRKTQDRLIKRYNKGRLYGENSNT